MAIAVAGLVITFAVILLGAFLTGSGMVAEARNEAAQIRADNLQAVAEARSQGEADLARIAEQIAARQASISADSDALGQELAQTAAARDAARAELEHFADLKESIGFDLVRFRDRIVIVVPEGMDIRRWNAAGLLDIARYNGRMFRVVAVN